MGMGKIKKQNTKTSRTLKICFVVFALAILIFVGVMIPSKKAPASLSCSKAENAVTIEREYYKLCFNKGAKQPYWVLQTPNSESFELEQKRVLSDFYQDFDIPTGDQASASDYEDSKWVIGNYLFTFSKGETQYQLEEEGLRNQYLFSVTSPQNPEFHKRYWKKLRDRGRVLIKKLDVHSVVVLSGPLFFEERQFLNPGKIPVPTHFFQVIAPTSNAKDTEAYIVPNKEIDESIPLDEFKVTLKEFEKKIS